MEDDPGLKMVEKSCDILEKIRRQHPLVHNITNYVVMSFTANAHALMGRVTGTGRAASAITGAFCAAETDAFAAAIGALVT